jgi:hypothetical protein
MLGFLDAQSCAGHTEEAAHSRAGRHGSRRGEPGSACHTNAGQSAQQCGCNQPSGNAKQQATHQRDTRNLHRSTGTHFPLPSRGNRLTRSPASSVWGHPRLVRIGDRRELVDKLNCAGAIVPTASVSSVSSLIRQTCRRGGSSVWRLVSRSFLDKLYGDSKLNGGNSRPFHGKRKGSIL